METLHEFMLATKAVEYLLAVGFLFLFIMFWRMLLESKAIYVTAPSHVPNGKALYRNSYISTGHTWLRKNSSGAVLVGIDDFLNKLIGSLQEIKVPIVGSEVQEGEPLFRLMIGSEAIQIQAPVAGNVSAINWKLIGSRPYEIALPDKPAWLVKVKPNEKIIEKDTLLTNDRAASWLHDETNRLLDFLSEQSEQPELAGITLADGGIPVHGALKLLNSDGLKQFEQEFLHRS